jgi:hypothetical protein
MLLAVQARRKVAKARERVRRLVQPPEPLPDRGGPEDAA